MLTVTGCTYWAHGLKDNTCVEMSKVDWLAQGWCRKYLRDERSIRLECDAWAVRVPQKTRLIDRQGLHFKNMLCICHSIGRNAIFIHSHLTSTCTRRSKVDKHRALSISDRSHAGAVGHIWGCCLQAPPRNRDPCLFLPIVLPSTSEYWEELVATYTFREDRDCPWSSKSHRHCNMAETWLCNGSRFLLQHQLTKSFHLLKYMSLMEFETKSCQQLRLACNIRDLYTQESTLASCKIC